VTAWWAVVPVAVALVLGLRRLLLIVTVAGRSMEPTLTPGARILVLRRSGPRVRSGEIVVLRRSDVGHPVRGPIDPLVVKRVAAVAGEPVPASVQAAVGARDGDVVPVGKLVVLGDGPISADSRDWGFSSVENVVGVLAARLP
jgi:signal peptidase I